MVKPLDRLRPGQFAGSVYRRGGRLRSKWGTTFKRPQTYRDEHSGVVVSQAGIIKGWEPTGKHSYGSDPKKKKGLKKPYVLVRSHPRVGTNGVRTHRRQR